MPVLVAYGMTEAAHQICSNRPPEIDGGRQPGSDGAAAGPEVAVLGPDREFLPVGQNGEVAIRGCPLTVWLVTIPVWLVMVAMTLVVLMLPHWLAGGAPSSSRWAWTLYVAGLWIVWLVFLLAYALGSAAGHLLAYNLPALVLFLAAALGWVLPPLRRVLVAGR